MEKPREFPARNNSRGRTASGDDFGKQVDQWRENMLLAQEIQNAATGDSSLIALAMASFTLVGVVLDKVFAFLKGRGGPTPDENARIIADIRAENARLSVELKARLDGFERGSREVRDIVIATKTIVDRFGQ